jgi:hypothetical protein
VFETAKKTRDSYKMVSFLSQSQAKQDVFVHTLNPSTTGRFFDIGSHDPIRISNTYALEKLGWTGYLFDMDAQWAQPTQATRTSTFVCTDVASFDWRAFLIRENLVGAHIDYLSFDVDEASLATLERFPFDMVTFGICTIEHDAYRFGVPRAVRMREILQSHGYQIVCKDVKHEGFPYEDWYVHPSAQIDVTGLACEGCEYTEIIQKLQTYSQARS